MKTVIEMAREAGIITNSPHLMPHDHVLRGIEHFAELVRADEREACAKVCDDIFCTTEAGRIVCNNLADAIRARSNT